MRPALVSLDGTEIVIANLCFLYYIT
jgi:hypothetical protein